MELNSAIYTGQIRHRRFREKHHEFSYQVFMMYLDLDELENIFSLSPLWSMKKWAPAQLKQSDFIINDPDDEPVKQTSITIENNAADKNSSFENSSEIYKSVQRFIYKNTGKRFQGKVRMLCNLRYFSYVINPITNYYCFDESGEQMLYVIAAVTNTPWGKTHHYLLEDNKNRENLFISDFSKQHHVSPFMPLDMKYHWRSNIPGQRLALHIENHENGKSAFDATLKLERKAISASSLNLLLVQFPLMTVKVLVGIYWQALKLFIKGVRFFPHPDKSLSAR